MDNDRKRVLFKVATNFLSKISFGHDNLPSHTPSHPHGRNKPHPIKVVRHAWNIARVTVGSVGNLDNTLLYSTINGTPVMISSVSGIFDDSYTKSRSESAPLIGDPRFVVAKRRSESYRKQLLDISDDDEETGNDRSETHSTASTTATNISYNPLFLDDPELRTGKHRTVMALPAFIVCQFIHLL